MVILVKLQKLIPNGEEDGDLLRTRNLGFICIKNPHLWKNINKIFEGKWLEFQE
jgi:hypothetical protein